MKMKMKKRLFSVVLVALLAIPVVAQATVIQIGGGILYFQGWQDDTKIHAKIGDNANYMVKASVKVGLNTYTSGFKVTSAYKSADRKWYANESSWYDYYAR